MSFNKNFWEKFLDQNGQNFDGYARLLYINCEEHFDLEEEHCTIRIFTDEILEVIIHNRDEREEENITFIDKYDNPNYIPMDSIVAVYFTGDTKTTEKSDSES